MSSQATAMCPADVIKEEWVLSRHILQAGGLIVEHQLQPSGECEVLSGLTHNFLVVELGNVRRQVFRIEKQEYDGSLLQGELLLIPAKAPFFGACETTDEILAFFIDPTFLHRISLEANCPHSEQVELLSVICTRDLQIESIVQSIHNEIQQNRWGSRLYLDSLANLLVIHLLRNYTSSPLKLREYQVGLGEFRLKRVLEYINAHLEQDIELADLAEVADFSQCYFASLFKQSMGIAPWQYVVQQRVELAKKLLKQRNKSISEIALQCGFNSQSHFTQQFRKMTGVTPKTYREC
ncbi:MAG: AraC family transcriptional regulator [Fischerella sp. CENA71]|nr:AraC family transcriptional regulator [Fischerella sp. CENA71]